jgi:hypothetical protein
VNTDPHPLADLIGGTTTPDHHEHEDINPLHDNTFDDF